MDVLQDTVLEVALGVEPQELFHLGIPKIRDLLGFDVTFEQGALNLVAQDDVCWVGHLVRIDADEAWLDAGDEAVQIGGLKGRLVPQSPNHQGSQLTRKPGVTAQLHLKAQGLAFMHRHASGLADRLAGVSGEARIDAGWLTRDDNMDMGYSSASGVRVTTRSALSLTRVNVHTNGKATIHDSRIGQYNQRADRSVYCSASDLGSISPTTMCT